MTARILRHIMIMYYFNMNNKNLKRLGRVDNKLMDRVRDKIFDYKANCAGNIGNISEQFNAVSENFIHTPKTLSGGKAYFYDYQRNFFCP